MSPFVFTLNIHLLSKYSGASIIIYNWDINITFFEKTDYDILHSIDIFLWLIFVQTIFYPCSTYLLMTHTQKVIWHLLNTITTNKRHLECHIIASVSKCLMNYINNDTCYPSLTKQTQRTLNVILVHTVIEELSIAFNKRFDLNKFSFIYGRAWS